MDLLQAAFFKANIRGLSNAARQSSKNSTSSNTTTTSVYRHTTNTPILASKLPSRDAALRPRDFSHRLTR
jgi:hypothetical protein